METLKRFLSPKVQGQVRHVLSAIGSIIAQNGYASANNVELTIGVVMALMGLGWSWFAPEKSA